MKLKKKIILAAIICIPAYTYAQEPKSELENGKAIFQNKCVRCHGEDGTRGKFGAKNLQISKLNDDGLNQIIANGKWIMPRWKKKLSPAEIASVITYIKTLRTN